MRIGVRGGVMIGSRVGVDSYEDGSHLAATLICRVLEPTPSLPLPQTKPRASCSRGVRVPPSAERPGAQERAQVRRLQGHVHQGQGVLQALARGQGALPPTRRLPTRLPPTRLPPRPKAARSRSGARGGGCRGANAAPVYDSPTALLRPVRRTALSRPQLLARSDGVPPEPGLTCARTLG